MSILSPETLDKDIDVAVREDVLMKTREGREKLLKIELSDLLNKFSGGVINEATKYRLMHELSIFGEHVNCKFCTGCQYYAEYKPQYGQIAGYFDYRPLHSIEFTRIEFVLQ